MLQSAGFHGAEHRTIAAAKNRCDTRGELFLHERLDQVVVGAAVESGHAILDGISSRQHQDRRLHAFGAGASRQRETVDARQADVNDGRVVTPA